MRRSGAPSVRNAQKRKIEHKTSFESKEEGDGKQSPSVDLTKRFKGDKLVFNIVWREQSTKKHKFWKGNGILEVHFDTNRGVLCDDAGKYLGSTDKFKISELANGFQLRVGNKEIEIQEQIVDQNEYWATRKRQVESRGWGTEEWTPSTEASKPDKALARLALPTINSGPIRRTLKEHTPTLTISIPLHESGNSETALKISEHLACVLRPHQREGVIFLYECLMGYRQKGDYHGCILADDMGLGKTLQVLTVANSLLRYCTPSLHRVLIVTPRSLVSNWNNEICKWLTNERMYAFVVDGNSAKNNRRKLSSYTKQLHMPFVIVSYETLVSQAQEFQSLNFDLLICDEAHRLKNADTKTYQLLRGLKIKHSILLTGTPVQNVLGEFFALADFVNPGILGSQIDFHRRFEAPIERGQSSLATVEEKLLADERVIELKNVTSKFLLRRLQNVNVKHLPKKLEYICFLCPSKKQHLLLRKAIAYYDREETISQEATTLELIAILRKICNHPCLLKHCKQDSLLIRALARHVSELHHMDASDSSKLIFVRHLLQETVLINSEKVILVSYHTKTLDVLQKLCVQLNLNYLRLDGSTSTTERNQIVLKFNAPNSKLDLDAFVLLLSAKAGGFGLNLIGASRLVLYDIDWNPANDAQALSRIWREGQQRDVHIYRLITAGCIEEKIFKRQISKANLGEFIDSKGDVLSTVDLTSMRFSNEELKDLFQLQYDFNFCDTHRSLKCHCVGNGQNLTTNDETSSDTKQFNELSRWKHWTPNADEAFMKKACIWNAKEELIYIFSNETVNNNTEL